MRGLSRMDFLSVLSFLPNVLVMCLLNDLRMLNFFLLNLAVFLHTLTTLSMLDDLRVDLAVLIV